MRNCVYVASFSSMLPSIALAFLYVKLYLAQLLSAQNTMMTRYALLPFFNCTLKFIVIDIWSLSLLF